MISPDAAKRPNLSIASVTFAGELYGVERMALATCELLAARGPVALFSPPGPLHRAAADLRIPTYEFETSGDFFRRFRSWARAQRRAAAITSSVRQSVLVAAVGVSLGRTIPQVSIVHGGDDDTSSFAHKKWLRHLGIRLVAVSEYVRDRLVEYGVPEEDVIVVENFIAHRSVESWPKRPPFRDVPRTQRGIVVGRIANVRETRSLVGRVGRSS